MKLLPQKIELYNNLWYNCTNTKKVKAFPVGQKATMIKAAF